jgi:predicted nucleic acid-binding protein
MELADGIVVDTSAFYALSSPEDRYHDSAFEVYRTLLATERTLFTTSYVLVETQALIMRRLGFEATHTFMTSITGIVEMTWVDRGLHDEAWRRFEDRRGAGLSLVDWTVVLTAQRVRAAVFTFDADFRGEGLPVIPVDL